MKRLKSLYSGATSLYQSSKSRKIFDLYSNQQTDALFKALKAMSPKTFIETQHEEMSLLHVACIDQDLDFIRQLQEELPYFSEIVNDDSNKDGWTPLLWAAQKSNLEIVQELIAYGASVSKTKRDGISVLHMAASNNDIHLLDYIVTLENENLDINTKNLDGWTPAHMAGWLDNFDSLNLLMENGADITLKNNNNLSAYEEIIRNDNSELLECIFKDVQMDQKARKMNEKGGFGILHLAASSPGPKTLQFLLNQGKEVPSQICNNLDKATPLHFSVLASNEDNSRILLRYGANCNAADSMGNTPLHFAVSSQNLKMVKILDEYGADATLQNIDEICPIDIAITEDIKDIKFHFSSLARYKTYDFSGSSLLKKQNTESNEQIFGFSAENI